MPAGALPRQADGLSVRDDLERIAAGIDDRPLYRVLKRLFDIAFSLAVLVLLSPVLLVTALVIWLDDPKGSPLFFQERVGKRGTTFRMVKFRTMCIDAEDRLGDLMHANEKDGPVFKIAEDPRVTRVGRLLRKTSLDEMPQFWNVLVGDMSVVGPRPALPREVSEYTYRDRLRLAVRPGITCYWQVQRRRDVIPFQEWVDLDLSYIQNASMGVDLMLIAKTVGCVLTAQGE
ncbi:hypothetical protein B5F79_06480 [Olsenella sp. An285]|uniref:sugar transferase n=1 Tax=Olsenella sp. An285 TaxID=1965621 RepID=UPI000B36A14F|nr:sugar transferase [Olsenella sp. An285]OUO46565.1 hypothetical protein B5F79_06480 [Olsenella sp. An285]